tara:strand:+ start:176 stop:856 length:681 start_codon:yes stop_codon:yes gene_type:complete
MKWVIVFLLLIPSSFAWTTAGHENVVVFAYERLDQDVRSKLNLTELRRGAVAPDLVFHDTRLHHFPPSYKKAVFWLGETELAYEQKNYNNASYFFGIASHYISDSFALPHNVEREDPSEHSKYERMAVEFIVEPCSELNHSLLGLFSNRPKPYEWDDWLITHDTEPVYTHFEIATISVMHIAKSTFESSCNNKQTNILKRERQLLNFESKLFLLLIMGYLVVRKSK